jgi:hypothetical protein
MIKTQHMSRLDERFASKLAPTSVLQRWPYNRDIKKALPA